MLLLVLTYKKTATEELTVVAIISWLMSGLNVSIKNTSVFVSSVVINKHGQTVSRVWPLQ